MKFEFDYRCDEEWDEMKGGDRRRFCGSCEKNVHHLSHMSKEEAVKFLEDRNYDVCVDFFSDSDGNTVFKEKPQKLGLQVDGLRQLVASAVALIPLALAAAFVDFDGTEQAVAETFVQPLALDSPTPIVDTTVANGALTLAQPVTEPPAPPTIEPLVEEPVVVDSEPEPEPPKVIKPIHRLRGKIRMPRREAVTPLTDI